MRHILLSPIFAALSVCVLCFNNARAADDETQPGFQSIHQQQDEEFSSLVLEAPSVPLAAHAPAKSLSAVTPEVTKMVFGYHPYWCDGKEDTYRYYWLTHIAYFSVGVNPTDGSLDTTPSGSTHWATRASNLISLAHANGVKVVLVATLFGTSSVSTFLSNSTARSNAVSNLLNEVVTYGVDGVDIDFEYVASSAGADFTAFMTDLANAFHAQNPAYHVSFAGPAGTASIDNLELSNLNSVCDSVFPMCYNYHWGGSSTPGPVAPLYGSTFWGSSGIVATINYYVTHGFDYNKVIVGLPNYGLEWPCDGLARGANTTGSGAATLYYNSHYDVETGAQTRLYDTDSDSPWWAYGTSPNFYQNWYDDHESLQTKINWAATAYSGSLGGVGFWALGYDCPNAAGDVYPKIWQAVGEELTDPPYTLDNFEVWDSFWRDPNYSGSTTGDTDGDSTFAQSSDYTSSGNSNYSAKLYYDFEGASGFIREVHYSTNANSSIRALVGRGFFDSNTTLAVWVRGDGSNNKLYFCVRDGDGELERSNPIPINWSASWQQISWDMASDPVNSFAGDGVIDGTGKVIKLDSIQLLADTATWTGTLYFDDLTYQPSAAPTPTPTPTPSPTPTSTVTPTPTPTPTPVPGQVELEDFEEYTVGQVVMFRTPSYSGSTTGIVASSDSSTVSDLQANDIKDPAAGSMGTKSERFAWQWSVPGTGFVRCTTSNTSTKPNPQIDLSKGLSVYYKVTQGEVDFSYWVRETGGSGPIGSDGGASGTVEECTNYQRISASSNWNYIWWDVPNESYSAVTGNGVLDGSFGTLEAFVFRAVSGSPATTIEIFVDDLYQGPEQTPGGGPTPTPTATPTATPSPTPSPTPTPTPSTVVVIASYDFNSSTQGWGFVGVASPPDFVGATSSYSSGKITIIPNSSTNSFGFWQLPSSAAIPYVSGQVYRARAQVQSSQSNPQLVPKIRLRWIDVSSLASSTHEIVSLGDATRPPGPSGKEFRTYYYPPISNSLLFAFDLLDFEPADSGTISLDSVQIERFPRPASATVLHIYASYADFSNWSFLQVIPTVTGSRYTTGEIRLQSSQSDDSAFGFWQSSGSANECTYNTSTDYLYRAIYRLRSDTANNATIRLRAQNEDSQMTQTMELSPGSAQPLATGTYYELYWETPELPSSPDSAEDGFILAFDDIDFDSGRSFDVTLEDLTIEYTSIP